MYCADIGSVQRGRFGWVRSDSQSDGQIVQDGTDIAKMVEAVATDLADGRPVALGFECPLFVPVPTETLRLGAARIGEGNRPWSAGAGAGALAAGLVQMAWVLAELHKRFAFVAHLDLAAFERAGSGLLLWEAFVTDQAKGASHVDDATIAVNAFRSQLPGPAVVSAERPLSLIGAALLWSGCSTDPAVLRTPCMVVKAQGNSSAPTAAVLDPATGPRAHRDRREVERKLTLLEEPHVVPLTALVRRLRDQHGPDSVPWFNPTEGGVDARILLCLENPGRRADAVHGSSFISPDNDDRTAENMWRILRDAGVDRREVVTTNIVPWYLGDADRIGTVSVADLDAARPALLELLRLLPRLGAVVLLGRKAQRGWQRAAPGVRVPVLETPHPSGRWLNANPADRDVIVERLRQAKRLSGGEPRPDASVPDQVGG